MVFVDSDGYPIDKLIDLLVDDLTNTIVWNEFLARVDAAIHRLAAIAFCKYLDNCSGDQASDFVQEVYKHLLENNCQVLRDFQGATENTFFGYLSIVCSNLARDRRRRLIAELISVSSPANCLECCSRSLDSYPTVQPEQERSVLRRELRDRIETILRQICRGKHAHRNYAVFMLHYYHEYTAKEVAVTLNITTKHVETIYHQVKHAVELKLATVLGRETLLL